MKHLITTFPSRERSSLLPAAFWKRMLMISALPAMAMAATLTTARAQYGHTGTQTYNTATPANFDGSVPGGLDYSVGFGGGFSSTPGEAVVSGAGNVHVLSGANLILGDATNNGGPAVEGTLNQTGGTVAVDGTSSLYLGSYGKGIYNLNGGTLLIGGSSIKTAYDNSGGSPKFGPAAVGAPPTSNYEFNLGGGTIQVTGSALTTGVTLTLTDNTISQIDTNGLGATLTGTLTGPGGLNKTGSGTLTLDGGATRNVGLLTSSQGSTDQLNGTTRTGEFMVGSGAVANAIFNLSGGDIFIDQMTEFDAPPRNPSFRVGDWGGTGIFNQTGGSVTVGSASLAGSLNIGNQGGTGTYNISGGSLTHYAGYFNLGRSTQATASSGTLNLSGTGLVDIKSGGDLIIGDRDAAGGNGNGLIVQTGGTLRIESGARLGLSAAGNGEYQLNGGTLEIGGNSLVGHYEGGTGTYALKLGGGTIATTSAFTTDVDASLTGVSTSQIDTTNGDASWSGNITGPGGLNKIGTGTLTLSGAANNFGVFNTYSGDTVQSGGTIISGEFLVGSGPGATGSFSLEGGTLDITGAPTFPGGSTSTLRVGDWGGTGVMTQKAGTEVNVTTTPGHVAVLHIGNQGGNGTYNLEGGDINVDGGVLALGRTATASALTGSTGLLNMTGGNVNLTNGSAMVIGDMDGANQQGTGTATQTGGTLSVDSSSVLYLSAYGSGTYNLNTGGALSIGGTSLQSNLPGSSASGNFNLGGGTIATSSPLTTSVDASLMSGTTSFIDTTGGNASWSGNLTGPGALNKIGAGTLDLSGAANNFGVFNTYSGDTVQSGGATTSGEFLVGSGTGANTTYTLEGGTLDITGGPTFPGGSTSTLRVGDWGGTGVMTQKAGTEVNITTIPGHVAVLHIGNQGGNGTYNLEGGDINVDGGVLALGRTATASALSGSVGLINMTGGNVNLSNGSTMVIGDMDGANQQGTGSVTQTGGVLSIDNSSTLYLSAYGTGTYNLNQGGTLEIGGNSLQSNLPGSSTPGQFNLGGGTIKTAGTDLNTSVNMILAAGTADGPVASIIDTNGLNATFSGNITNSAETSPGRGGLVKIGDGILTLSGANARSAGYLNIDKGGAVLDGGSLASSEFVVGGNYTPGGGNGDFTLTSGDILITGTTPAAGSPSLRVGDFGGTGVFNQNGGSVTIGNAPEAGSLNIGNQGGEGTYNLAAGTLTQNAGSTNLGRRTGSASGTGNGTLNVSGTGHYLAQNGGDLILGDRDPAGTEGNGTVNQTGGTVEIASGSNLYLSSHGNGTYNLNGGRLEIGGTSLQANYGGGAGTYAFNLGGGTIAATSDMTTSVNATLVAGTTSKFEHGDTLTQWSGVISGSGDLQSDTGNAGGLAFTVPQDYTGKTTVSGGNFGSVGLKSSEVIVKSGTTYFAGGTNTGALTLNGGRLQIWGSPLAPGGIDTLTVGSYSATAGSSTIFDVGAPGISDTINVTGGSITLGGALAINNTGGYNYGTYTLFTKTGATTVTGAYDLSSTLKPNPADSLFVQSDASTVKLYITTSADVQYWLGTNTIAPGSAPTAASVGHASTNYGTWNAGNANWSTADGLYTTPWQGKKGVFLGTGSGTKAVTLEGNASFEELEFQAAGYSLSGGSLTINDTLSDPDTRREIQVDTGTVTIASSISGDAGLEKTGGGSLVLSGANTFTGDTRVSDGRLTLSGDLSGMGGDIENNSTLYFASTQPATTFNGDMTGTGSVTKNGNGETSLTGDLSYNAITSVTGSGSVLRLKDNFDVGGGLSAPGVSGNRFNVNTGATLILDQNEATGTFGRNVTGAGMLQATGTGELTLTGTNNHTGGTIIGDAVTPGGTVHISSSAQLGAADGNVTINKATLDILGNGKNITQNLLGSVRGGAIQANGNLFLGALDGSSTIDTGATIIAGSHDVYLISDDSTLVGTHTASVKVGGISLASGGSITALNGINVKPGGMIQSTGSADFYGDVIVGEPSGAAVPILGPAVGSGDTLKFNSPLYGNYIAVGEMYQAPGSSSGFSPGSAQIGIATTGGTANVTINGPLIEIGGTSPGSGHDVWNIENGNLNFTGNLVVTLFGGYTPANGDFFNIVNVASNSFTNTFNIGSGANLSLPALPSGLSWDTSDFMSSGGVAQDLNNDGKYSLAVVPETSSLALLALAGLGLSARRKRHAA